MQADPRAGQRRKQRRQQPPDEQPVSLVQAQPAQLRASAQPRAPDTAPRHAPAPHGHHAAAPHTHGRQPLQPLRQEAPAAAAAAAFPEQMQQLQQLQQMGGYPAGNAMAAVRRAGGGGGGGGGLGGGTGPPPDVAGLVPQSLGGGERKRKRAPPLRSKFSLETRRQLKGYSDEEIKYAEWIGVNVEQHPHLLTIARQGIAAPVPEPWVATVDDETEEVYYYNQKTGESSAEHPLDQYYREWCAAAAAGRDFRVSKEEYVSRRVKTVQRALAGAGAPADVRFTDRATGHEIRVLVAPGGEGITYTVNGDERPVVHRVMFDARALMLQLPDIGKGLTVPKDNAAELLRDIRKLCDSGGVDHDLPAPPTAAPQAPGRRVMSRQGQRDRSMSPEGEGGRRRRRQHDSDHESPSDAFSPNSTYASASEMQSTVGGGAGGVMSPDPQWSPPGSSRVIVTPSNGDGMAQEGEFDFERRPPPEVRDQEALFEDCLERLKPHGLGMDELIGADGMPEAELDELLKGDLGYSVIERHKIKQHIDNVRMQRRADEKNRQLEEQMEGYETALAAATSPSGTMSPPAAAASPAEEAVPVDPDARDATEMQRDQEENEALVNAIGIEHVPEEFVCTITGEIMADPVVTGDGHVYEREAIKAWLAVHDTSPNTNAKLTSKNLIPNLALRRAITTWKSAVREAQQKGALGGGPGGGGARGRAARRQQRPGGQGPGAAGAAGPAG
eukprot:TRINITY_DN6952_c1_g2_i1.p1 TRINITY_DN6952_c1_g2~~TRINITY_DN6952_c1_g2_i1.p1  ORF type:complete len:728 (+),score=196.78 TRINITY_DN6952_c1_g2_i1:56-2239(+)